MASDAAQRSLDLQQLTAWQDAGFTFRTLCHYNKTFVVWRHFMGEPLVVDSLTVKAVSCDTRSGLAVRIHNQEDEPTWITHHPSQLFGYPVFAHIPYLLDISYLPIDVSKSATAGNVLRFPVVFRTQHNPKSNLVEEVYYLSQVGEFRNTYPEFKDRKF